MNCTDSNFFFFSPTAVLQSSLELGKWRQEERLLNRLEYFKQKHPVQRLKQLSLAFVLSCV